MQIGTQSQLSSQTEGSSSKNKGINRLKGDVAMNIRNLLLGLMMSTSLLFMSPTQTEGSVVKNPIMTSSENIANQGVQVQSVLHPQGDYFIEDSVALKIKLVNTKAAMVDVVFIWQIRDDSNKRVGTVSRSLKLSDKINEEVMLQWKIPSKIVSGVYTSNLQVLIPPATFHDMPRLIKTEKAIPLSGQFGVFSHQDNFALIDEKFWKMSTHQLGLSRLSPENIRIDNETLKIRLPANSFEGGEIQSVEVMPYGMYEAKLKLPNVPSSITGFFLYTAPDYYHEIDIEIQNDPRGVYYLTTYANGKVSNSFEGNLGFDPTAAFHTYRIVYSKTGVSYYIDQKLIKKWTKNLPEKPMHLMLNAWYPTWLKGSSATGEEELLAEWIRY